MSLSGCTWSLLTTVVEKRLSYAMSSLPWLLLGTDFWDQRESLEVD